MTLTDTSYDVKNIAELNSFFLPAKKLSERNTSARNYLSRVVQKRIQRVVSYDDTATVDQEQLGENTINEQLFQTCSSHQSGQTKVIVAFRRVYSSC